jgi:hypothetical protein
VLAGRFTVASAFLHAHMPHRITPVAIPGAAADGAELEDVVLAGGEAVDRHGARLGEEAGAEPRALHGAGGGQGVAAFVHLRVRHRSDTVDELPAAAVANVLDRRRLERALGAVGRDEFESGGEDVGDVIVAELLHVAGEFPQEGDEDLAHVVLVRGGRRTALDLRGDGRGEVGERALELHLRDRRGRRVGEGGVAVEAADHRAGSLRAHGLRPRRTTLCQRRRRLCPSRRKVRPRTPGSIHSRTPQEPPLRCCLGHASE